MRVLLDHCVPRDLADHIHGFDVVTVAALGWETRKDGALLNAAATGCEVFVTLDKNIVFQQRLAHRPFGIVVLRARSSRMPDLLPLVPNLLEALVHVKPCEVLAIAPRQADREVR